MTFTLYFVYTYNVQMKHINARDALLGCERELRGLVAESASEGDYRSVMSLTALARAVADLAARTGDDDGELKPSPPMQERASVPASDRASSAQSKRSKENYPQFFRRGDELVKVGWSKRERKEYHHRAPRSVIDAIGGALQRAGAKGRLFNGGDLMPVKASDNSVVPDYQVYVVLAWMKDLGLVKQRGRRAGYTFTGGPEVGAIVNTAWPKLTDWKG